MKNLQESYRKAVKVVESCENFSHMEAARNYVNLFFRQFSTPTSGANPRNTRKVDNTTAYLYTNLLKAIKLKEKELRRKLV